MGVGSIIPGDGPPSFRLHTSLGRGKEVPTECMRRDGEVFPDVEAMVTKNLGVRATRWPDKPSGQELVTVE